MILQIIFDLFELFLLCLGLSLQLFDSVLPFLIGLFLLSHTFMQLFGLTFEVFIDQVVLGLDQQVKGVMEGHEEAASVQFTSHCINLIR